jgi:glycosyltransferase involved in cell wall biosynthesis
VQAPGRLEILFAAERLRPAIGGGERYAVELLEQLAERHRVRAIWLRGERPLASSLRELPPPIEGVEYPAPPAFVGAKLRRRLRRRTMLGGIARALSERPADVLVSQVGAAPVVIDTARAAGVPGVLLLPSYDSLCRLAFVPGSMCRPESGCLACSNGALLQRRRQERLEMSRRTREAALLHAAALIAPSDAVADVYERWIGRRPVVAAPVVYAYPPVRADPGGHVLLVASHWSVEKGRLLLEPIVRGLSHRRVVLTARGLPRSLKRRLERMLHVSLADYLPTRRLFEGAGALLVPSQWPEPFGRVAFEGLSAGVPTLASAVGGLPSFVPASQLVRPHDDPAAWIKAARALEEPARWRAAREDGLAAGRSVLATRPVERIEETLVAATRP